MNSLYKPLYTQGSCNDVFFSLFAAVAADGGSMDWDSG